MIMNKNECPQKRCTTIKPKKCSDAFIFFRSRAILIEKGEKKSFYFLNLKKKPTTIK